MSLIALLTDFGTKDYYVGAVKAVLKRFCPRAELIDITHEIDPWSLLDAEYLLNCCFDDFPDGTIFLVVVDPGVGTERRPIIVKTRRFWFVGPDNGVFAEVAAKDPPTSAWAIVRVPWQTKSSHTFHGRDIFAPVAAFLACGGSVEEVGEQVKGIVHLRKPETSFKDRSLVGYVAHIDRFGNVATSIDSRLLQQAGVSLGSTLHILVDGRRYTARFYRTFGEAAEGELIALINSCGVLELAVNRGRASDIIGVKVGTPLEIKAST